MFPHECAIAISISDSGLHALLSCFSCAQLFVILWTVSLPGSSVHGILQARILEWTAIPFFRGSSCLRDQIPVSYVYLHWQVGSG